MTQREAGILAVLGMALAVVFAPVEPAVLRAEPQGERLAVPGEEDQEQARKLVQDVFKPKYEAATTGERQAALAEELFKRSGDTAESATSRYVLLSEAGKFAVKAKSIALAFQIVQAMGTHFAIDTFDRKVKVALAISKTSPPPQENDAFARSILGLMEECVTHDQFETAERLGEAAAASARKSKDATLARQVVALNKEIKQLSQLYDEVTEAAAGLQKNPADPVANLKVGKYRCFVAADWEQGLPLLARCSDEPLKALAIKQLQGAADAGGQAALGDAWWEMAMKEDGLSKRHLQEQATAWYQRALPGLSGLVKKKIEKRMLAQLSPSAPAEKEKPEKEKPEKKTAARPKAAKLPLTVAQDRKGITPGVAGDNLYPFVLEHVGRHTEARLFISGRGGLDSYGQIVLKHPSGDSGGISIWSPDVLKPNPINANAATEVKPLVVDISKFVDQPGAYEIAFVYQRGNQGLIILRVEVETK